MRSLYTKAFLLGLRRKAVRRRVWYRGLDSLDRGIFCLVTRVVDRVESALLGTVLVKIVKRLRDAMKSEFARLMESSGFRRAREIADKAVEWGNRAAKLWARDSGFARYHTLLIFNKPSGWGV